MDTKYKALVASAALAVGGVFFATSGVAAQNAETEVIDVQLDERFNVVGTD